MGKMSKALKEKLSIDLHILGKRALPQRGKRKLKLQDSVRHES